MPSAASRARCTCCGGACSSGWGGICARHAGARGAGAPCRLWAALLVWLGAHLREHCGIERVGLVLQGFVAFGGFLVAITGFVLQYQIDWLGVRLVSGDGTDGMVG